MNTWIVGSMFDPATGSTKDIVRVSSAADRKGGAADLVLTNSCWVPGGNYVQAMTTANQTVTYTPGYPVTSADIPATVTSGSTIVLPGRDVNTDAQIKYWISGAQGIIETIWGWTGPVTTPRLSRWITPGVTRGFTGPGSVSFTWGIARATSGRLTMVVRRQSRGA